MSFADKKPNIEQNNKIRLVLMLSEDVIFKPMVLKLALKFAPLYSIVGVVECAPKRSNKSKNTGPLTEWGIKGTTYLASLVLFKKIIHFICKRIGISQQHTIKGISKKHNLAYLYAQDINSKSVHGFCLNRGADTGVSFQHQKIKQNTMNVFKNGIFNIHPSNLPKYRGVKPIHWAALNGDQTYSVSLHSIGINFDTGDVWVQKKINLLKNFSIFEYYKSSHIVAAFLIADLAHNFEDIKKESKVTSSTKHKYYNAPKRADFVKLHKLGWKRF